jgi:chromosome segregation ATPase
MQNGEEFPAWNRQRMMDDFEVLMTDVPQWHHVLKQFRQELASVVRKNEGLERSLSSLHCEVQLLRSTNGELQRRVEDLQSENAELTEDKRNLTHALSEMRSKTEKDNADRLRQTRSNAARNWMWWLAVAGVSVVCVTAVVSPREDQ